jgi:hypothetical protein
VVVIAVGDVSVQVQVRINEVIQIQVVTVEINRVPIVCIHEVVCAVIG